MWGTLRLYRLGVRESRFIPTGVGNTVSPSNSSGCTAVHPHGCGEHVRREGRRFGLSGSSPRVWGTLQQSLVHSWSLRFIPTGVGNTQDHGQHAQHDAVHPHGCGEHCFPTAMIDFNSGSSPRVWGTRCAGGVREVPARFIPTGVGNTLCHARDLAQCSVHPHGCGEHMIRLTATTPTRGSSPRVWGTRPCALRSPRCGRFIPTGVGNTHRRGKPLPRLAVHPHGCGEHCGLWSGRRSRGGSSPRVWGTRTSTICAESWRRFIPTGVGNTLGEWGQLGDLAVHPHGCGEHHTDASPDNAFNGSSPRVWGTLHPRGRVGRYCRFIPTGVGNTNKGRRSATSQAVHPHGCGEHVPLGDRHVDVGGSSPRVWGTPAARLLAASTRRFIPTGVGNTHEKQICQDVSAVHPHGCGEHPMPRGYRNRRCGSSPRVWGTHRGDDEKRPALRFIPTGVGNTSLSSRDNRARAVHPHGCGEHILADSGQKQLVGSSPRVWGTLRLEQGRRRILRFIPTGVGNTRATWRMFAVRAVHPHGCGEHEARPRIDSPDQGSSPRVWGTLPPRLLIAVAVRFIPTGVGNTSRPLSSSLSIAVHPHGCGEHRRGRGWSRAVPGSSPRVWGTQEFVNETVPLGRFIPTGVGNTITISGVPTGGAVHPHGCGEHVPTWMITSTMRGSSPRVWGTPGQSSPQDRSPRFIPTGVGNTPRSRRPISIIAVHPHGCGEHFLVDTTTQMTAGSSPRVWGTHLRARRVQANHRFIPTGVGNTQG